LFLFHLYKKAPPNAKEIPPINAPIATPITIGIVLDCFDEDTLVVVVEGVDDILVVEEGVGNIFLEIEGSKMFVHIYSLLLLMSSNKMSLSVLL